MSTSSTSCGSGRTTATGSRSTAAGSPSASADSRGDRPDCVITADPVAFLLVGYGRVGQSGRIWRGKLRAGGRRPWLALRFSSLLIRP